MERVAARAAEPALRRLGTHFFDYDNDGWVNSFVVNGHDYPQMENANLGTTYRPQKLLFHNDGDIDAVVENLVELPQILIKVASNQFIVIQQGRGLVRQAPAGGKLK